MATHASNQFYHLNGPRPHPRCVQFKNKNKNKNNKNNTTSHKDDQFIDVFLRPQTRPRQNQRPPTYRVPYGQRKPSYNKQPRPYDEITNPRPQYPKRPNNPYYNNRPYKNNTHPGQGKPFYRTDRDGDVLMQDVFTKPSNQSTNRVIKRGQQRLPRKYIQDIEMIDAPVDFDGDTIMMDV
ncbi:hypothetical protein BO94DRAFT_533724 [Aspergillus sclerotioniger CBS 115572]|uniref:Uncharacterized protein n=1 Tax=Aspergillus sclerotioniger CBS 115572 TaxID=1450535 RepID=A0A317WZY3_9EURO|nr:hypothetical protein BO94DRAFT_533724 [Aspergillus sclerotioniger CBS 115572]PWY91585.1 hypothetical protein BO94DRAFT_533724 [Aspergillus sclerotioniger CBS 115572]